MLVIDSGIGPFFGKLTAEMQFFPRIPRALFPDKPDDWGMFYLVKFFFPAAFEKNSGFPDFGYGVLFADFGVATPIIVSVTGFLEGMLLKSLAGSVHRRGSVGEFVVFLYLAGVSVVPVGGAVSHPTRYRGHAARVGAHWPVFPAEQVEFSD